MDPDSQGKPCPPPIKKEFIYETHHYNAKTRLDTSEKIELFSSAIATTS